MGLGRWAPQRDVGGVLAPPQHRIRHSRQFIPPERAKALLVCARVRSRAARPRPQHRDLEHRQLVGNGRAARKRVRSGVSHAEERRLRGVAASRQGASEPPGTDHLRCRERRPHRHGISLAGAFATSQLQGHSDARSPIRSELSGRLVPAEEPSPSSPTAESRELLEQEDVRAATPPGAQPGWRNVEEPERRNRELRSEIAHLAIEAYCREEISRGRVLELSKMLGMKGDVLLRLAKAAREE